jgi:CDP-glucose 4,6-dehydratase
MAIYNTLFNGIYNGKKVLVTGSTGFKGSWLCVWLTLMGARVYGFAKDIPTKPSLFETLGLSDKITNHIGDIRNYEGLDAIVRETRPDFIFHLAAQPIVSKSYQDPLETVSTNVIGTAHVLEAVRNYSQACTVVIITSDKCYDNIEWVWGYRESDALGGKDIYSGSKGCAELVFRSYHHSFFKDKKPHIKLATARAGNVIGGGDWAQDRIIPDCMRSWSAGNPVEIRSPNATRPWQHVLEPLSGYLQLAARLGEQPDLNGESFNFGPSSGCTYTVRDIMEYMRLRWHFEAREKACRITGSAAFHEAGLLKLNCDKALYHLQWIPVLDYQELLDYTCDWYYEYYQNKSDMFAYTVSQIDGYISSAAKKGISWTKRA